MKLFGLKAKELIDQFSIPVDEETRIPMIVTFVRRSVEGHDKLEVTFKRSPS